MFIARACLDMLIRSTDISKARAIRDHFRGTVDGTPLLNFLDFFMECLVIKEIGLIN